MDKVSRKVLADIGTPQTEPKKPVLEPGITVQPDQLVLLEGKGKALQIKVKSGLKGRLVIGFEGDKRKVRVRPNRLVFKKSNKPTTKKVRIVAIDNDEVTGNQKTVINLRILESKDMDYNFVSMPSVSLTIRDNDRVKAVEKPTPQPSVTAPAVSTKDSSDWIWHTIVLGATGVAMLQSQSAANEYNSLNKKQKELGNTVQSTQSVSAKAEFESNQSKMKSLKSSAQTWDMLTILGLLAEGYLLYSSRSDVSVSRVTHKGFDVAVGINGMDMRWLWRF